MMGISVLPEQLENLLSDNKVFEYQVVSCNERKGRWLIRACTISGEKILIKWNEQTQEEACKCLSKEMEIYSILGGAGYTPQVISSGSFLALEYIENSCTLRSYVKKSDDVRLITEIVENALNSYLRMLDGLNKSSYKSGNWSFGGQLSSYVSKLLLSGPEDTNKHNLEKFRNRIYSRLVKSCITPKSLKNCAQNQKAVIHGDFHLNNEIVSRNHDVLIIDFEDVMIGSPTLELAYWYAQIWALLYENENYVNILNKKVDEILMQSYFEKDLFWKVVSLYRACISANSRFHKSEKKFPLSKRIKLWQNVEFR